MHPYQPFVSCLKPEILHERDLPNPAATLVRWPCRVSPARKGCNVSQKPSEGTGRQGCHLSPRTVLYCIVRLQLNRLFGSFQCSRRNKARAMHGGWQGSPRRHSRRTPVVPIGSLGDRVGVPTVSMEVGSLPPRLANPKRSILRFPHEVLIMDGRATKASPLWLTDRQPPEAGGKDQGRRAGRRGKGRGKKVHFSEIPLAGDPVPSLVVPIGSFQRLGSV